MYGLDYYAGIFDGEGYVYIFKKVRGGHTGYYISAGVNMCHYPTVKILHQTFGGHLNRGSDRKNPKHRPTFQWGVSNKLAAVFLKTIRPHVLIKADEIDVALALQRDIEEVKYIPRSERDIILARREKLFQQCKQLKQYSFTPLLRKGPWPSGRLRGRPPGR